MPFDGLRVLSLESRRAEEMATLIRKQGGEPFVAPSMREVAIEEHGEAFAFADRLLRGEFDCVILLTGVGTRLLWKTLLTRYPEADLKTALEHTTLVVRGPKPSAAVREIGLVPRVQVPEPNTWRELLETDARPARDQNCAAGIWQNKPKSDRGLAGDGERGYAGSDLRLGFPADTAPLRQAAARLIAGEFDVVLLTTSMQLVNLMKIAEEEGIEQQVREALTSAFRGFDRPDHDRNA